MAVNLSPVGGVAAQFFTNSGAVLTGGKLYTYAAGTTTPQVTYTTSQGSIPWTNPIVLDAAGRVPSGGEIWLINGLIYKFILKDSNDVLIATYDNITGINSNVVAYTNQQEIVAATAGQTVFNLGISYQPGTNSLSVFVDGVNQYGPGAQYSYVETNSTTVTFNAGLHVGAEVKFTTTQQQGAGAVDASQVSYDPPFVNSVPTNVEAKLAQTISVLDFGADPTGAVDSSSAIQNAINYAVPLGATVFVPSGNYKISSTLNIDGASIQGNFPSFLWYGVASGTLMTAHTLGFGLYQINFDGRNIAGTGLNCGAISSLGRNVSFGSRIINCEFTSFTTVCMTNEGSGTGIGEDAVDMRIELSAFRNSGTGVILSQPWHVVHGCYFTGNTYGVTLSGNSGVNFSNTIFTGIAGQTEHILCGSQTVGQAHFSQCWFENGTVFGFAAPGTNASRCVGFYFSDCHISYQESQSGSIYVVDLDALNSGNVSFVNCYFDRTTNQSLRFGNAGATIINCAFRDIGQTDNQAVRYVEYTPGSVILVGSNGFGGVRTVIAAKIVPPTVGLDIVGPVNLQSQAGNDAFSILPSGDFLVTTQATGVFPDTTAVLLDTTYRQAFAYIWGQEAGSNLSVGLYSLLYNGSVWTISSVHQQAIGNGNGTTVTTINGNYLSITNASGNPLGSWRVKIQYFLPI